MGTPELWFLLAGSVLLVAVWLWGFEVPFFGSPISEAPFFLGLASALGGWVFLLLLLRQHPPAWKTLALALVPLAVGAAIASWRFWLNNELFSPLIAGVLPPAALAWWTVRGGLGDAAAVALWVPSLAIVAGLAWYFKRWRDPRWEIPISEMAKLGVPEQAEALLKNIEGGEEMKQKLFFQQAARVIAGQHWKHCRLPMTLSLVAACLSAALFTLAPAQGRLGLVGTAVCLPAFFFWWKGIDARGARAVFLGGTALAYEAMLLVLVVFVAGQLAWAWTLVV